MEKRFRIVPRGVGLVIGCCTFPTWNGYPGFFASLATGNTVVVKPHPAAILPLAISVRIIRDVLTEAGFDPNVVTLVAHPAGDPTAQQLALRPEVKLIDFTGSSANGNWLEANARQAQVYTEKSGVNQVIVDSVSDLKGGRAQPGVLAVALHGPDVHGAAEHLHPARGHRHRRRPQELRRGRRGDRRGRVKAARRPGARGRGAGRGGQNEGVDGRLDAARGIGQIVLDTQTIAHPAFPRPTSARR